MFGNILDFNFDVWGAASCELAGGSNCGGWNGPRLKLPGGGIGNLLYNDYFAFSKYRSAGTGVAAIVIVVAIMDFASAKLREKLV